VVEVQVIADLAGEQRGISLHRHSEQRAGEHLGHRSGLEHRVFHDIEGRRRRAGDAREPVGIHIAGGAE
jgi:hypothetical protein